MPNFAIGHSVRNLAVVEVMIYKWVNSDKIQHLHIYYNLNILINRPVYFQSCKCTLGVLKSYKGVLFFLVFNIILVVTVYILVWYCGNFPLRIKLLFAE